jgi:hypothetical protein
MKGGDGKSVSSFLCKAHSTIPQGVVALSRRKQLYKFYLHSNIYCSLWRYTGLICPHNPTNVKMKNTNTTIKFTSLPFSLFRLYLSIEALPAPPRSNPQHLPLLQGCHTFVLHVTVLIVNSLMNVSKEPLPTAVCSE